MKVNILGTKYNISYVKDNSCLLDNTNAGECDYSKKTIRISKKWNGEQYSKDWMEETLYHELAHAFLHQSGNEDLNDERHAELLSKFVNFIKRNNLEVQNGS